jgi:hypothetical protein
VPALGHDEGYGELAFSVIENALDDLKRYQYSKDVVGRMRYESAKEFLAGGPMLSFWCSVLRVDTNRVIEGVRNANVHAKL